MKQGAIIEEIGGEPASGSEGTRFQTWHDTYGVLQWAEIECCLGAWVETAKPAFGPEAAGSQGSHPAAEPGASAAPADIGAAVIGLV